MKRKERIENYVGQFELAAFAHRSFEPIVTGVVEEIEGLSQTRIDELELEVKRLKLMIETRDQQIKQSKRFAQEARNIVDWQHLAIAGRR